MRKVSGFCDYFVIASALSLRQVNAIASGIQEDLSRPSSGHKEMPDERRDIDKIRCLSKVSPTDESGWVVLDYASVVAHIFYKPMREFYSLERLWGDAKRVSIPRGARK